MFRPYSRKKKKKTKRKKGKYSCPVCKDYFDVLRQAHRHLWVLHDVPPGAIFKCRFCKHETKLKNNMQKHLIIHNKGGTSEELEQYYIVEYTYGERHVFQPILPKQNQYYEKLRVSY